MWSWLKKLFRSRPKLSVISNDRTELPSWYITASKELGQKEIYSGDNPRILEYHSATVLHARKDEIPWCASFVCWCLEESGIRSTKSAWAKSYLDWGMKLDIPRVGAIAVFKRGSGGHVGFYVAEDHNRIVVLGGNQSDSVSVARLDKKNLIGYRWPVV